MPSSDEDSSLDSEDDYGSGCQNVSHQQVFLKTTLTRMITLGNSLCMSSKIDRRTVQLPLVSFPLTCTFETFFPHSLQALLTNKQTNKQTNKPTD